MEQNNELLELVKKEIGKIKDNKFTFYFYTMDTMGNPQSTVEYIYRTAKSLSLMGYNVAILHSEETYYGVKDWMGESYNNLPHIKLERKKDIKNALKISASDFLIIPEIMSNIMISTKDLPCTRIVLCDRYERIFEMLPISTTWVRMGMNKIITTNETLKTRIERLFGKSIDINTIEPYIGEYYNGNTVKNKDFTVTLFGNNPTEYMRFIKEFSIRYPHFRWVSFIDTRGRNDEQVAEIINKTAFAVILDTDDDNQVNALKAINSGCITLCKYNEVIPEWALDKNGNIRDCITFANTTGSLIELLNVILLKYGTADIPQEMLKDMEVMREMNRKIDFDLRIKYVFEKYKDDRLAELNKKLETLENNEK